MIHTTHRWSKLEPPTCSRSLLLPEQLFSKGRFRSPSACRLPSSGNGRIASSSSLLFRDPPSLRTWSGCGLRGTLSSNMNDSRQPNLSTKCLCTYPPMALPPHLAASVNPRRTAVLSRTSGLRAKRLVRGLGLSSSSGRPTRAEACSLGATRRVRPTSLPSLQPLGSLQQACSRC